MPLISPVMSARLLRHWQLVMAAFILLLFLAVHMAVFQPSASRYRAALKRAVDLGAVFDPEKPVPVMPPRVLALLSENSLPPQSAAIQRETGVLAANLLEDLTQITNRQRIVVQSAEPGATSHEDKAIQVRAHLKLECSFAEFTAFLDDLSRSPKLTSVDRFSIVGGTAGHNKVDLWVTRYILKQIGKTPGR